MGANNFRDTRGKKTLRRGSAGTVGYIVRELAELALVVAVLALVKPFVSIPTWVLIGLPSAKLLTSAAFYVFLVRRTLRRPPSGAVESLIGTHGRAMSPLRPTGQITVGGEIWSARSLNGTPVGWHEDVRIVGARGNTLLVARADPEAPDPQSRTEDWNSGGSR
jgi:membrane-bound ClpP family serine protease